MIIIDNYTQKYNLENIYMIKWKIYSQESIQHILGFLLYNKWFYLHLNYIIIKITI